MAKRNWKERQRYKHERYGNDEESGPESADFGGVVLSRADWESSRVFRHELSSSFEVRKLAQYLRDGWRTRPGAKDKREPFEVRKLGQYLRDGWRTRPGAKDKREPFEFRKIGQYFRDGWRTRPGAKDKREPFDVRKLGQYLRDGWRTRPGASALRYGFRVEILDRHQDSFDREISSLRDWRDSIRFCRSCGGELYKGQKELCRECFVDIGNEEIEELDL